MPSYASEWAAVPHTPPPPQAGEGWGGGSAAGSHRPVALHRDPVARAGVRPVIPHRVVLNAAIVPERDRVLAPAEAALEQRVGHVLVKIAQDAVAFVARQAVDIARKALVDVERLPTGHRMRAHDRVIGGRITFLVRD